MENTKTQISFTGFPKMGRLSRECVISEKIDGTNAQIYITDDGQFLTGSRTRWIVPGDDNFGFSKWAHEHEDELMTLGPGQHFGEWWGAGIQRKYGLTEKRFSLFNVGRWVLPGAPKTEKQEVVPPCCGVVPTLFVGEFTTENCSTTLERLRTLGSVAAPGFMDPEGIIIYHTAANVAFKKTIKDDASPKSLSQHV